VQAVHRQGINLRYLGRVCEKEVLKDENPLSHALIIIFFFFHLQFLASDCCVAQLRECLPPTALYYREWKIKLTIEMMAR
jgi:hypothetical protein